MLITYSGNVILQTNIFVVVKCWKTSTKFELLSVNCNRLCKSDQSQML